MGAKGSKGAPNNVETITLLLDANQGYYKGPRGLSFHTQMPYNNLRIFVRKPCVFAAFWCRGGVIITPPEHLIIRGPEGYFNPPFWGLCFSFVYCFCECSILFPQLGTLFGHRTWDPIGALAVWRHVAFVMYRCLGKSQKAALIRPPLF